MGCALREGITRNLQERLPYIIYFIIYYLPRISQIKWKTQARMTPGARLI